MTRDCHAPDKRGSRAPPEANPTMGSDNITRSTDNEGVS